jgi:hypothetical protein
MLNPTSIRQLCDYFIKYSLFIFVVGCSTSVMQPQPNPDPIPVVPDYLEFKNYSLIALYENNGWNVKIPNNGSVKIDLNSAPDPVTIAQTCETLNGSSVATFIFRYSRNELKQLKALHDSIVVCNAAIQSPTTTNVVFSVVGLVGQQIAKLAAPIAGGTFNATTSQQNVTLVKDSAHLSTMLYFNGSTDTIPTRFDRKSFIAQTNTTVNFDSAQSRDLLNLKLSITPPLSVGETAGWGERTIQGAGGTNLFPIGNAGNAIPLTGQLNIPIFPVDALETNELHEVFGFLSSTNATTNQTSVRRFEYYFRSPTVTNLELPPSCTSSAAERVSGLVNASTTFSKTSNYSNTNFGGYQQNTGGTRSFYVQSTAGVIGKLPITQLTALPAWKIAWGFDATPINLSATTLVATSDSLAVNNVPMEDPSQGLPTVDGSMAWSCAVSQKLQ